MQFQISYALLLHSYESLFYAVSFSKCWYTFVAGRVSESLVEQTARLVGYSKMKFYYS